MDTLPRRILVYGVTGSGKTTLAAEIAVRTGLPWHEVDALTWRPGWVVVPPEEQRAAIEAICATDAWVIDTAYAIWLDVPLARAELVIGLDYPRWVSLGRLVRRTLSRALDGQPVCNGNVETWRQVFSRDSIIAWHFRSFPRKRARIRAWAASSAGPQVVRLTSPRETRRWLATLAA